MSNFPKHIGFIVDGNRRWAKSRGLSINEGHKKGLERIRDIADFCFNSGGKFLTFFLFSTENWKRSKKEVNFLLKKIPQLTIVGKNLNYFHRKGIKIVVSGRKEKLPLILRRTILKAEKLTKNNKKGVINFAINYGGRAEIVDATKLIIKKGIPPNKVTEELIRENLYSPEVPDPDLIIRTAGEQRISNFLLWQLAYSEFYFSKKYWPDFSEIDMKEAIKDYQGRERKCGK